jgi:hypothetical protein
MSYAMAPINGCHEISPGELDEKMLVPVIFPHMLSEGEFNFPCK